MATRARGAASSWLAAWLPWLVACALACDSPRTGPAALPSASLDDLAGTWRVVIDSPGGELPVTIEIFDARSRSRDDAGAPAIIHNPPSSDPITEVNIHGRRVTLRISHYDAALTGELDPEGKILLGTWQKTSAHGRSSLPFRATRGESHRFSVAPPQPPGDARALSSVTGIWAAEFHGDSEFPALGELDQKGDIVTGTFLTSAGDTRYLTGRYQNGVLELSSFNGAFASLFRARARADGSLSGQFWSNDDEFFTWKAVPISAEKARAFLPDPYAAVKVTSADRRLRFRSPDLEGKPVSIDDERFRGKVVLVVLMGSWCQNCNDEAPLLTEWYRRYRDRGLEIVSLSYEFTGDRERDRQQVEAYKKRHGVEYPLLLAGTTDDHEPLDDISAIPTYPTTIFLGRDGTVHKIHAGFAGPSTGEHYQRLIAEFESDIDMLLDQPAP
jgi:thiol-disulfide isomerase/thioredoxin